MRQENPASGVKSHGSYAYASSPAAAVVTDFFGADFCRLVRRAMDHGTAEPAEVLDRGPALDREARRASSIEIDPSMVVAVERRLDAARLELSGRCGVAITGREGAGFLRYAAGGYYRVHRDRAVDAGWPAAARRLISIVVFLNTSAGSSGPNTFTGGELLIYPESESRMGAPMQITPREGSLVAFDAALLHEVRSVAAGTRDVIVDWFY